MLLIADAFKENHCCPIKFYNLNKVRFIYFEIGFFSIFGIEAPMF